MARSLGSARERSATGTSMLAYGIFFASGFAALLYQVIWQRMLALFSGADVFSVTLIVAAFMGGLGLGNLAGGHLADRLSRSACFVAFAVAEAAIALFALASKLLYYDLLYTRVGAIDLGVPLLAAILFVAVLWPTFFMGVSLPLLARGLTRSLDAAARTVGSLYGWNTLGAAAGAFIATWVLLRRFDLETGIQIGAALNFACALAALPLRSQLMRQPAARDDAASAAAEDVEPARHRPILGLHTWLLVYMLSGTIALSLEIAWFRVLGVMLKSTSFTFGTLLPVYLTGIAAGSLVGSRLVERSPRAPAARFFAAQTFVAVYALGALCLVVWIAAPERFDALFRYFESTEHLPLARGFAAIGARWLGVLAPASEDDEFGRTLLLVHGLLPLVLIGPATFLMGLSFPFLQRTVQTDARFFGRRVGWLQTANIAGSLAGSFLTGFVLLPLLGTTGTFRALALASLAFPLLAWIAREPGVARRMTLPAIGALALVVTAVVLPRGDVFWARLHAAPPDAILVEEDASGVSLLRRSSRDASRQLVMAGGVEVSTIPYGMPDDIHTMLGVLPVLIHPDPRRVAVIGVGSGDTAYAAARAREQRRDRRDRDHRLAARPAAALRRADAGRRLARTAQ